jgi:phage N-6-adenine-methyltransferase
MFSSVKTDWETPQNFFNNLDDEFHFTLDVCATGKNTKCKNFISLEQDSLSKKWDGVCWMNPPYGRLSTPAWIKKAYEESLDGATVVCLVPSRTDTKWFHEYCLKGEIRFVKGRLKFGGCKDPAPFPSMVVIFKKGTK